jgi:hypothetical protein
VAQARSNAGGQPAAAPPVVTAQVEDRELHVEASESYLAVGGFKLLLDNRSASSCHALLLLLLSPHPC